MTDWKNRILRHGIKPAVEFTANPHNPRIHPKTQREAVRGSLDSLGWIAPVIELANGDLLDGHERIWQALQQGDDTPVPYIVVDLTEDEAKLALLTFDFITAMATFDRELTAQLMEQVNTDNAALQSLIAGMAEDYGVIPAFDSGNATHSSNGSSGSSGEYGDSETSYTPPDSTVRMVQLFLTSGTLDEFYTLTEQFKKRFAVNDVTSAVMEALRYAAAHS